MAKIENSKQETETSKSQKSEDKKKTAKIEDEKSPEVILKEKKAEAKAVKKAGPKHTRAKLESKVESLPTGQAGRKSKAKDDENKTKHSQRSPRTRLERRGKNYKKAHELIDTSKKYAPSEAVEMAQKTSFVKFDASVELHVRLNVDPKQADQMVRGTIVLPHGTGKSQRVAALVKAEDVKAAKDAGADVAGEADLLDQIGKGKFDFDVLVTTPDMMPKLGKLAKELGPKGLMPNPKSGTVTDNVVKAVKELRGGRVEFRIDSAGIIHQVIGKCSYKAEQLEENLDAMLKAIRAAKPEGVKGTYLNSVTLTTSMGPAITLDSKA